MVPCTCGPRSESCSPCELEVINPIDGGHSAKPFEGFVVNAMPCQLVHAPAPNHRRHATVAERHHKPMDLGGLATEVDFDLQPIALRLCTGWSFNSPKRTQLRLRKRGANILRDRLVRT